MFKRMNKAIQGGPIMPCAIPNWCATESAVGKEEIIDGDSI